MDFGCRVSVDGLVDKWNRHAVRVVGGVAIYTDAYSYNAHSDSYRGCNGHKDAYPYSYPHSDRYGHATDRYTHADAIPDRAYVHAQRDADAHTDTTAARVAVQVQ